MALLALCVVVVAIVGAVLIAGLVLSRPVRFAIGPPPPGLANAETVHIASESGSLLSGWWLTGEPGDGCVVLMHGVRRSRRNMIRRAEVLHQNGFSVLLFDFQAHGESPGRRITFGGREAMDAAAAVAFARRRVPEERIGVIGVSLGGAAALLGPAPLPVDALVLESIYPDLHTVLGNRLRKHLGPTAGPVMAPLLRPLFELLMLPVLGVGPAALRPIDHIAAAGAPVLVASGTRDVSTTIAEARSLFARAAEPKQFWAVEGAAHVDLQRHDPDAYWRLVLPFLIRYVRRGGA